MRAKIIRKEHITLTRFPSDNRLYGDIKLITSDVKAAVVITIPFSGDDVSLQCASDVMSDIMHDDYIIVTPAKD